MWGHTFLSSPGTHPKKLFKKTVDTQGGIRNVLIQYNTLGFYALHKIHKNIVFFGKKENFQIEFLHLSAQFGIDNKAFHNAYLLFSQWFFSYLRPLQTGDVKFCDIELQHRFAIVQTYVMYLLNGLALTI